LEALVLLPLADREQLKRLLHDLEASFGALPLFRAGRREIVRAWADYADQECERIVSLDDALGWLDGSSPYLMEASRALVRLTNGLRQILSTMARMPPGSGPVSSEVLAEAFEVATPFATVARALRHMLKRQAWGAASYDAETREVVLANKDDEIQARESFNSMRLRGAQEKTLRAGMQRGLSPEGDPDDLHLNDVERLNPAYTKDEFNAVMRAIREFALAARAKGLCAIQDVALAGFEQDIASRSGVATQEASAVIGDLVFAFDAKSDAAEQFLLEIEPCRLAIIPLLVVERELFATTYIGLSRIRYPGAYGAYQKALTRTLESEVGEELQRLVPGADVRQLKLPGGLGEIDRVVSDPATDALLLVEVKYLLDHDNARIAEGIAQLQRDERVVRERWAEVSRMLLGWNQSRFPPAHLGKLLVTNWFLGTESRPKDIRVLALKDDLRTMAPTANLRELLDGLSEIPEPRLVPRQLNTIPLFGYTFRYYTSSH
jgi:hypothetical protein